MSWRSRTPCPICGIRLRARNPNVHALMCSAGQGCTAAYRCFRSIGGRCREYCEKERGHEGSCVHGALHW